jgi:hypothetical protein
MVVPGSHEDIRLTCLMQVLSPGRERSQVDSQLSGYPIFGSSRVYNLVHQFYNHPCNLALASIVHWHSTIIS